jgi:fructokinase
MKSLCAAIEAGGTKWICAIGDRQGNIIEEQVIPTIDPNTLMPQVASILDGYRSKHGVFEGIGIGTFGPVDINNASPTYGSYINTPKEGWSGFNLIEGLKAEFSKDVDIYLDTDVNTAVYAEHKLGAAVGHENVCYITVGTGIGGGVIMDGKILKGRMHPEIGHTRVLESTLNPKTLFSVCPFHIGCVEGKASGTAMAALWGTDPSTFPPEAWKLEANYLAQLAVNLTACYSPDVIVFGGGVMKHPGLLQLIHSAFEELSGGYWELGHVRDYIKLTGLNDRAGLVGALLLAPK